MMGLTERVEKGLYDMVTVVVDGEEIDVYNEVTVTRSHSVTPNQTESYTVRIEAGNGGIGKPAAVSQQLAETLATDYNIDLTDHGIDVIDPTAEEVDLV